MAEDSGSAKGTNKFEKKKRGGKGKLLAITLIILGLIAGLTYFAYQYNEAKLDIERLSNPEEASQEEAERLSQEVGEKIQLPKETPTVATVVDAAKLKDQPFFANAKNNDKVLIYTSAKKAVLYRPSTKKVIEVAPINIGDGEQPAENEQTSETQGENNAQ